MAKMKKAKITLKNIYKFGIKAIIEPTRQTLQKIYNAELRWVDSDKYALEIADDQFDDSDIRLNELNNLNSETLLLVKKLEEIGFEEEEIKESLLKSSKRVVKYDTRNAYARFGLIPQSFKKIELNTKIKIRGKNFHLKTIFSFLFKNEPDVNWVSYLFEEEIEGNVSYGYDSIVISRNDYYKLKNKEIPSSISLSIQAGEKVVSYIVDKKFERRVNRMIKSKKNSR